MKWLIWKEFRLNWLILAIAGLLLIVPYVVAGGWAAAGKPAREALLLLMGGYIATLLGSIVILALLGGQSIAGERADRSAEFLAYQPVSRSRIVISKLVWPSVALAVMFGQSFAALAAVTVAFQGDSIEIHEWISMMGPFWGIGLCAFLIAWGVSALQSSPTFAVMSGIAVPIVIGWLVMMINWSMDIAMGYWGVFVSFSVLSGSLSLLSFVGGTWYYLRRVEP